MKKISRKQLKQPDEFIGGTQKAFLFISHHSKRIATAGVIVFIVLLAVFLYQKWDKSKEEGAYRKFSLALQAYQNDAQKSEYKNALAKFEEVIAESPGTFWGRLALLYKGDVLLQMGSFEEAIGAYDAFLQKNGKEATYRLFALEGLGYAYEGKKAYQKAIEAYQKIIDRGGSFELGNAYFGLGRCYEKLGKNKEALENYKSFLRVSQKSQMANAVLRKISHLEKNG